LVGEYLFCNANGCNKHDFEIRAYGVCAYLDITRRHKQALEAQINANSPSVLEGVKESIERPLLELVDYLTEVIEYRSGGDYKPPFRATPDKPKTDGGGIPL